MVWWVHEKKTSVKMTGQRMTCIIEGHHVANRKWVLIAVSDIVPGSEV